MRVMAWTLLVKSDSYKTINHTTYILRLPLKYRTQAAPLSTGFRSQGTPE